MTASHRLARLLEMITLFHGGGGWGPRELAAKFGISETRIYHDIRELNHAGISVSYSSTGYKLDGGSFLPALNLTPSDVLELLYPEAVVEGRDPLRLEALRAKVLSALPADEREGFRRVLNRTDVSPGGGVKHGGTFETVHRAIADGRRVEMVYFDYEANETTTREVEPYGLVYRRKSWYCVGRCLVHGQVRKFRFSRIREVKLTPFTFEPPENFSLAEYLIGSWELFDGRPVEVLIRFTSRVAPLVIDRPARPEQSIQKFSDGSILYRAKVNGIDEICWWLTQYGHEAEVLRPRELREKLLDIAKQIVRLYSAPAMAAEDVQEYLTNPPPRREPSPQDQPGEEQ